MKKNEEKYFLYGSFWAGPLALHFKGDLQTLEEVLL